jgi:hypothetical protein
VDDDPEVARVLADPEKQVTGDLAWAEDEDQSAGREFVAAVRSPAGAPLLVRGQWCGEADTLRFSLLLRGVGRIAALDLGHDHEDPDGRPAGRAHFHRGRSRVVAVPPPEPGEDPIAAAWRLFCRLTHITHDGRLAPPPPRQEALL